MIFIELESSTLQHWGWFRVSLCGQASGGGAFALSFARNYVFDIQNYMRFRGKLLCFCNAKNFKSQTLFQKHDHVPKKSWTLPQKIDRFMGFPQPPKPPRPTQAASMTRPKPPRPNSRTRRKAPSGTLAARRSAEKRHKMDGWKGDKLKDWKQNCMKYYEVMYIYIYTLKLILYLHIFVKSNFYPNSVQWDTF